MSSSESFKNLFAPPERLSFCDASCALITLEDGRYLMQLRDDKPGIFYPDHWGLFGGGFEPGETAETSLRRELEEELGFVCGDVTYFTKMNFGFDSIGAEPTVRVFFEFKIDTSELANFRLSEGRAVEAIEPRELLTNRKVVPYDSFAIWLHYCREQGAWPQIGKNR